jgi:integrase
LTLADAQPYSLAAMPCSIRTRGGFLVYRLRCRGLPGGGYESQERTGLRDTPANRQKLEKRAAVMTDEMKAGTFDYLRWFPRGAKALHAVTSEPTPTMPTLREYAETTWLPRMVPPAVRAWCAYDYRKHLRSHILPAFGDFPLDTITTAALVSFRAELLAKGLSMKSCRNVIDATLRALLRDARAVDKLPLHDPFADLPPKWWPRRARIAVDPFTEEERDKLLDYFARKHPHWHPFMVVAFWTGARPSELAGLRWGDVELRAGKVMIRRSRTMGEDNACKTEASERTIELVPIVTEALQRSKPLHVTEETFVFLNTEGRPVIVDNLNRVWHPAIRATGIRPRKFYATRHTFISAALARGARVKWVATYCGTSIAMIEKHYSKWLEGDAGQLALLTEAGTPSPRPKTDRDSSRFPGVHTGSRRVLSGNGRTGKIAQKR